MARTKQTARKSRYYGRKTVVQNNSPYNDPIKKKRYKGKDKFEVVSSKRFNREIIYFVRCLKNKKMLIVRRSEVVFDQDILYDYHKRINIVRFEYINNEYN